MDTTISISDCQIDFVHVIDNLKVFDEQKRCEEFISSLDTAEKVGLIVSGSTGEKLIPSIHSMNQILCIYIFCFDVHHHQEWGKKFNKIRGIFNDPNALLNRLQRDLQLLLHHFTPVNIFTMQNIKETTLQNVNREQGTYMWFQLLIETLLRLPRTSQAHQELVDECLKCYRNDDIEKRKIERFKTEYKPENVVEWYTRDSFLYRLVNRAFRTRNIETIFKYRYFIVDLHQRLTELHQQQYAEKSSIDFTVYRGQLMSVEELNKLTSNIGGIFSVNTFLSTTTNSIVAVNFIMNLVDRPFAERVLYEINVNGSGPWKWPFADIHQMSCNEDEGEFLFDMGSTFRIDDVYEYTPDLWCISLTLLDIHDPSAGIDTQLYEYLVKNHLENAREPTFLLLCDFLEDMGEYEKARDFCHLMLKDTPEGQQLIDIHVQLVLIEYELGNFQKAKEICEETLAMQINLDQRNNTITPGAMILLHNRLGLIKSELGDYKSAIDDYLCAVSMDELFVDVYPPDFATHFNNLGLAYKDLGDFKKALYWLEERALKIQLEKLPHNHPKLAITYSNIGDTYSENGNYNKARENYERVVSIENAIFAPLHPSTEVTFNNLGVVCQKLGDYSGALSYHRQALEVLLHSYSLDHILFAATYNNMGAIFDCQGDFEQALSHYDKALEYLLSAVGTEQHPNIAATYNNIGMVHYEKEDYRKAFEYFEKTRQIEEKLLERNHSSLATTYNNLGMVLADQGNLKQAMEYHQRALTIRRRVLSKTHPELATSYDNLGVVFRKKNRYKTAIDYHQRALSIQNQSLPQNHPSIATTKEHLGDVYVRIANYRAAHKTYEDAVKIASACLPESHPSIKKYVEKTNNIKKKLVKVSSTKILSN